MKQMMKKGLLIAACLLSTGIGVTVMLPDEHTETGVVYRDKTPYNSQFFTGTFEVDGKQEVLSFHKVYEDNVYPGASYNVVVRNNYLNPFRPNHEIVQIRTHHKH